MMEVASIAIYGFLTKPSIWTEIIIAHQRKGKAMDDLISKKAAIDALNEYFSRIGKLKRRGLNKGEKAISLDTVGAINSLPPAEPQIIRCKDCENWDTTWTNDFSPNYHYCPMVDGVRKEDWFCADAERREVNHESN